MELIFNYLKDHRGASINTIAACTGVNTALVLKLVQKGNLEVFRPAFAKRCEKCGQAIDEGKYCQECGRGIKAAAKAKMKIKKR